MHADHEYLAAGYVLGGLSSEEQELARTLEATDPEFRAELTSFQETMALVGESDTPVTPSAETEAAVLRIPQQHPVPQQQSQPAEDENKAPAQQRAGTARARMSQRLFALAASALFIVAAVLGTLLFTQVQQQQEIEQSLNAAEVERQHIERLLGAPDLASSNVEASGGGSLTVTYSVNEQMIHVVPHDVPSPDSDQTMQMWLIDDEGPHSLGLMSGESAELVSATGLSEGVAFGITIEPEGGSPEPTDDPIVVAEL